MRSELDYARKGKPVRCVYRFRHARTKAFNGFSLIVATPNLGTGGKRQERPGERIPVKSRTAVSGAIPRS